MATYSVITNFQTTLAQGMTSSQTTCVLSSVTLQGHAVTSADYGAYLFITINPGASNMEVVRATTNTGTTFTLDKRGLAWYGDTDTELSAYKFTHNAGEIVVISNVKNVYDLLVDKISDETVGGVKTFTSLPTIPALPIADTDAASKKYVDDTADAGAPNATTGVKGIVQLATQAQNNAGTATGSTAASLVATPAIAAVTVQNAKWTFAADAQASDTYVITLAPAITAYTAGQMFAFTANTANTGAATLNVNGLGAKTIKKNTNQDVETGDILSGSVVTVIYDGTNFQMQNQQASMPTTPLLQESATFFANTAITGAQATTLSNGSAADALHFHTMTVLQGTRDITTVSGTQTIAHGLAVTPKYAQIIGYGNTADTNSAAHGYSNGFSTGSVNKCTFADSSNTGSGAIFGPPSNDASDCINMLLASSASNSTRQQGVITFDATNVTITWTRTVNSGGGTGVIYFTILVYAS